MSSAVASPAPLTGNAPAALPTVADLERGLNAHQLEAFRHTDGAALVLAGAGSGKTTVLMRRIARLILEGVAPGSILVTTFTKRAAQEMQHRLTLLLGEEAIAGVWIGTFHAHCLRILKKEWAELYGKEGKFDLADEGWQKRVCRAILGKPDDYAKLPQPPFGQNMRMDPKVALLAVSAAKNLGFQCDQGETALQRLYPDWEQPAVENTAVRMRYQAQFQYVMVDETQDTSTVQWEFARTLAEKHGNLFVVGDVGQSIYGFRGCDPRLTVMAFKKAFPMGDIVRLPANYRSQGTVVTVANELIAHADLDDRYRLFMEPTRAEGTEPILSQHVDAESEAAWVVEQIRDRLQRGGGPAVHFKDFAILYRTNAYSRCFEDALIAGGIPYAITGGTSFYNRRENKDLLAYLQLSVDPHSAAGSEAAKRILNIGSKRWGKTTRGLGRSFIEQVEKLAEKWGCSFYEALRRGSFKTQQDLAVRDFRRQVQEIHEAGATAAARLAAARQSGYDDYVLAEEGDADEEGEGSSRLENLDELVASSAKFHSPEAMLTFVAGQVRKANESSRQLDAVNLMTIHRSKGLEWDTVFVVGFAMNLLPHHRCLRYVNGELLPESLEEERRLAYVAITRAKERFCLSWPQYHNAKSLGPSPFLVEMPTLAPFVETALAAAAEANALLDDEDVDPDALYANAAGFDDGDD